MKAADRLFIATFPTGLSYVDTQRERDGDYKRVAFLPFATLELEWDPGRHPSELRELIEKHAALMAKRRGQSFQVSSAGQTVALGRKHHATKKAAPAPLERRISAKSSRHHATKKSPAQLQREADEILGVLGAPGTREPLSSGLIALRLGIHWRTSPAAYERVGKTLAKLKKDGLVVLERGKGWRLSETSTSSSGDHHATKKSPARLQREIDEALSKSITHSPLYTYGKAVPTQRQREVRALSKKSSEWHRGDSAGEAAAREMSAKYGRGFAEHGLEQLQANLRREVRSGEATDFDRGYVVGYARGVRG